MQSSAGDSPPNHWQSQRPNEPLPPQTVLRSTSIPPPPVCNFVSYILMCVFTYITSIHKFGLFEGATCSENITRTPWASAPSLPIPDTTYPKKRTTVSSQKPTLQTPSSPKHPGTDAREDPLHQKSHEITVDHAHKALLPPTKPEHDVTLWVLFGSIRHEASTSVSSAHRRRHGVGRGQPLTDTSPDTIPHICSPSPALAASCPPPFKFTDPLFFLFLFILVDRRGRDALRAPWDLKDWHD
jgi:hypothetical protein